MKKNRIITAVTIIGIASAHFVWYIARRHHLSGGWLSVGPEQGLTNWIGDYFREGHVWMGYSYAIAGGFTAYVIGLHLRMLSCSALSAAGGLGIGAVFAALGCFLTGCCGSPMLAVYVSIFGSKIAGFTQPLVAVVTTLSIILSYLWLARKSKLSIIITPPAVR